MNNSNNTIRAILACIQQKTKNNPNHQFTLDDAFTDGKTIMNDDLHNTLLDMEREGLIKGQ